MMRMEGKHENFISMLYRKVVGAAVGERINFFWTMLKLQDRPAK